MTHREKRKSEEREKKQTETDMPRATRKMPRDTRAVARSALVDLYNLEWRHKNPCREKGNEENKKEKWRKPLFVGKPVMKRTYGVYEKKGGSERIAAENTVRVQ